MIVGVSSPPTLYNSNNIHKNLNHSVMKWGSIGQGVASFLSLHLIINWEDLKDDWDLQPKQEWPIFEHIDHGQSNQIISDSLEAPP